MGDQPGSGESLQSPGTAESPSKLSYSPRYRCDQNSSGSASDSESELAYKRRYASVYQDGHGAGSGAAADAATDGCQPNAPAGPSAQGHLQADSAGNSAPAGGNEGDSDDESIARVVQYTHSASLSARSAAAAAAALAARTAAMSERISSGLSGQSAEAALQLLEQETAGAVAALEGSGGSVLPNEVDAAGTVTLNDASPVAAAHPSKVEGEQTQQAMSQIPPEPAEVQEFGRLQEPTAYVEPCPEATKHAGAGQEEQDEALANCATAVTSGGSPRAPAESGLDDLSLSQHRAQARPEWQPAPDDPGLGEGPDVAAGTASASPIATRAVGTGGGAGAGLLSVYGGAGVDGEAAEAIGYDVALAVSQWQVPGSSDATETAVPSGEVTPSPNALVAHAYSGSWLEGQSAEGAQQASPGAVPSDAGLDVADGHAQQPSHSGAHGGELVAAGPAAAPWQVQDAYQAEPGAADVISTSALDLEGTPTELDPSGLGYPVSSDGAGGFAAAGNALEEVGGGTLLDQYRVAAAAGLVTPELASILGLAPPPNVGDGDQSLGSRDPQAGSGVASEAEEEEDDGVGEEEEQAPSAVAYGASGSGTMASGNPDAPEREALGAAESSDVVPDLLSGGAGLGDLGEAAVPGISILVATAAAAPGAEPDARRGSTSGTSAAAVAAAAGRSRGQDPFYAGDTDEEDGFVVEPLQDSTPQTPIAQVQQQQRVAAEQAAVRAFTASVQPQLAAPGNQPVRPGPAAAAVAVGAGLAAAAGAAAMGAGSHAMPTAANQAASRPLLQQGLPPQVQRGPVPPMDGAPPQPAAAGAFAPPHGQARGVAMQPQLAPQGPIGPPPGGMATGRGSGFSPSGPPLPTSMRPSASPATPSGSGPALQLPQPQILRMSPAASPRAGAGPAPGAQPAPMQLPGGPMMRMPAAPGVAPGAAAPGAPPHMPAQVPPARPPQVTQPHPGQVPPGARPLGPMQPGAAPPQQGPAAVQRPPGPPGIFMPGPGGPGAGPGRPQGPLGPPTGPMGRGRGVPGGLPVSGAVRPPMMAGSRPPLPPAVPPAPPSPYPGLLYTEGRDALGRPVVVLNTAMLPGKTKKNDVLQYVLQQLQPVVQHDYVLVVLSLAMGVKASSVSSTWALGAYRSLAKPYRKNVKHIILVQPSAWARALLALAQPFVSKKAAHKIKKVDNLVQVAGVTNGEVKLESLGARFIREIQYGLGAPPLAGLDPQPNGGPRPQGPAAPNGAPQRVPLPGPVGTPRPGMPPGQQPVRAPGPGTGPLAQPLLSPQGPNGSVTQLGARPPTASNVTTPVYGPGGPGPATMRPAGPLQPRPQLFPPGPGAQPALAGVPRPMRAPPAGPPGGPAMNAPMGWQGGPPPVPGR